MLALLAALCVVFHCGPVVHPAVVLDYVDRLPDPAITAGVQTIVEGHYLAAAPSGSGTLVAVRVDPQVPVQTWGYLEYISDGDLRPLVLDMPGTVTLFILPDAVLSVPPDASCTGCLVTASYHQVTADGVPYGVVGGHPSAAFAASHPGYPGSQPIALYDAAHELVEAANDAEIADPCTPLLALVDGLSLPEYTVVGTCTLGA